MRIVMAWILEESLNLALVRSAALSKGANQARGQGLFNTRGSTPLFRAPQRSPIMTENGSWYV